MHAKKLGIESMYGVSDATDPIFISSESVCEFMNIGFYNMITKFAYKVNMRI